MGVSGLETTNISIQEVPLLCIGAGGGAYPAAFRLAKTGRQVLMVDSKGVMSGNCLYEGCVPSKAVRETAAFYDDRVVSRISKGETPLHG
ncbi:MULTISPECIES: FAD-dependent oxidoreductase [Acidithiobacillus]|uniref:FAD-dependent oxidoreductase n=1 Tax=Acidithiobacillus sp. TaxID=1872118 RepID=UPI0034A3DE39